MSKEPNWTGSSPLSAELWGTLGSLCNTAQEKFVAVQFCKLKCGLSLWDQAQRQVPEPLGHLWSSAPSAPMGPATAASFTAGEDADSHMLVWKCKLQQQVPPSPSLNFLLKPGNMEGWKANVLKGHIYRPWSLLEQQNPCWKHRATRKTVAKKIKANAGLIFQSIEFTTTVKSFDTKGSCLFWSTNIKQKGTHISCINILVSAGFL